jgi:hypothetical protein
MPASQPRCPWSAAGARTSRKKPRPPRRGHPGLERAPGPRGPGGAGPRTGAARARAAGAPARAADRRDRLAAGHHAGRCRGRGSAARCAARRRARCLLEWLKAWPPASRVALDSLEAWWRGRRRVPDRAAAERLLAQARQHLQPLSDSPRRVWRLARAAGRAAGCGGQPAAPGQRRRRSPDVGRAAPARAPDEAWQQALSGGALDLPGFLAWVVSTLELAPFLPPPDAGAEVVLTPLARAFGRPFGQVVVPGADHQHLGGPEPTRPGGRCSGGGLGPGNAALRRQRQRLALVHTLRAPRVTLLRRHRDGEEPLAESPEVDWLLLAREQARLPSLALAALAAGTMAVPVTPQTRPAPDGGSGTAGDPQCQPAGGPAGLPLPLLCTRRAAPGRGRRAGSRPGQARLRHLAACGAAPLSRRSPRPGDDAAALQAAATAVTLEIRSGRGRAAALSRQFRGLRPRLSGMGGAREARAGSGPMAKVITRSRRPNWQVCACAAASTAWTTALVAAGNCWTTRPAASTACASAFANRWKTRSWPSTRRCWARTKPGRGLSRVGRRQAPVPSSTPRCSAAPRPCWPGWVANGNACVPARHCPHWAKARSATPAKRAACADATTGAGHERAGLSHWRAPWNRRRSTPMPATRRAAWWSKPVPVRARPGCWSRASCVRCWPAPSRSTSWPSPSRARPPARCANGWKSGCRVLHRPQHTRATGGCAVPARPFGCRCPSGWRPRWASCTNNCCAAAAAWRCAPSTAGLRSWRPTRRWACSSAWACPRTTSRWKTSPCLRDALFRRLHRVVQAQPALLADYRMLVRRHRRSMLADWLTAAWLRGPNSPVPMRPATWRRRAAAAALWPACAGLDDPAELAAA